MAKKFSGKKLAHGKRASTDPTFNIDAVTGLFDRNKEFSGIEPNKAVPLGIILNELLTNSVKHALSEKTKNRIDIDYYDYDDHIIIKYSDQSPGIYENKNNDGAGAGLIDMMLMQLKGSLTRHPDSHWITLDIPK